MKNTLQWMTFILACPIFFWLNEINAQQLDPPENLQATVTGSNVQLTWNAPGSGGNQEELIYDNNTATSAYKFPGFTMSTRMSPAEPCQVLTLRFYTTNEGSQNQFYAKVFNWNNTQPGTTLLYNSTQNALNGEWVDVDVSGENMNVDGDFVVGFGSYTEEAYLGYDQNLNNGRSWDFNESEQIWTTWDQAYLIRAVVQYASGKVEELMGIPETRNIISSPESRNTVKTASRVAAPILNQANKIMGLQGYAVYRNGYQINSGMVTGTYYYDAVLPIGTYLYTVVAVYDEGVSDPAGPVEATITSDPLPNPSNLGGQLIGDQVNLWWVSPEGGTEEELIYDNNEITGSYKYPGVTMSTRMSPSADCEVIMLKYYTTLEGSNSQFYARMYSWEGDQPGNYMYLNRSEEVANNAWVGIDVEGNNLYFTGDFMVGFGSVSEDAYLGYDGGYDNGRSWDRTESSQTWASWTETYMIRAVVRYGDGTLEELGSKPTYGFMGYNLYRNGEKINEEIIHTTSYIDVLPGYGDYDYNVSAVYDEGESSWSGTASFSYYLGINEFEEIQLRYYPNPATGRIMIDSQSDVHLVEIISFSGVVVYRAEHPRKQEIIDLGSVSPGIYLLKAATEKGTATAKIMLR